MLSSLLPLCAIMQLAIASMPAATTDANSALYWEGTAPLIIFAQIDGDNSAAPPTASPTAIPDRQNGCYDGSTCTWDSVSCPSGQSRSTSCRAYTSNWANTKEIAQCLYQTINVQKADGTPLGTPHLIMNNLKRIKLDSDREINEAAQQDTNAKQTFQQIHTTFTNTAVTKIKTTNGCGFGGLLIDITGSSYSGPEVHFRYKLTKNEVNQNDVDLNTETDSSIKDLIEGKTGGSVSGAIRGTNSLSKIFRDKITANSNANNDDFDVLPPPSTSPTTTIPSSTSYISGNQWTLQTHGSQNTNSETDAIQIALHSTVRTGVATDGTTKNWNIFCTEFSAAIEDYMKYWYSSQMVSCNSPPSSSPTTAPTLSPTNSPTYPPNSGYEQGVSNYTGYRAGDGPLIILSSHGGDMKPSSIPDRLDGCTPSPTPSPVTCIWNSSSCPSGQTRNPTSCNVKTSKDSYTQEIATCVYNKIVTNSLLTVGNTVFTPHLVVTNLHRSKLDTNREINEGAQQNTAAKDAWKEIYEKWIPQAAQRNMDNCDIGGLVLDVHGQAGNEFIHLGYKLGKYDMNDNPLTAHLNSISIKALINGKAGKTIDDAVRGNKSLTQLIDTQIAGTGNDVDTVPIQFDPWLFPTGTPTSGTTYYSGGEAADVFGSHSSGSITDAIQIEIPSNIRFNNNGGDRDEFCEQLANAITEYVKEWYDLTKCKTYISANALLNERADFDENRNDNFYQYYDYEYAVKHYQYFYHWVFGIIVLILLNIACCSWFYCKSKKFDKVKYKVVSMDSETDIERVAINKN